jgi:hypothetical protein
MDCACNSEPSLRNISSVSDLSCRQKYFGLWGWNPFTPVSKYNMNEPFITLEVDRFPFKQSYQVWKNKVPKPQEDAA